MKVKPTKNYVLVRGSSVYHNVNKESVSPWYSMCSMPVGFADTFTDEIPKNRRLCKKCEAIGIKNDNQ